MIGLSQEVMGIARIALESRGSWKKVLSTGCPFSAKRMTDLMLPWYAWYLTST